MENSTTPELPGALTPPPAPATPNDEEKKKKHKHPKLGIQQRRATLDQAGAAECRVREDSSKVGMYTPRAKKAPKSGDEKIIEFNYFSSEPQYVVSEMILRQAVENEITFIDVLRKTNKQSINQSQTSTRTHIKKTNYNKRFTKKIS